MVLIKLQTLIFGHIIKNILIINTLNPQNTGLRKKWTILQFYKFQSHLALLALIAQLRAIHYLKGVFQNFQIRVLTSVSLPKYKQYS